MKTNLLIAFILISCVVTAQITFERPFGDSHRTLLTDIAEKPQGGYIVCGSDCNTFPCLGYVASLDDMGNMLWQNYFFTPDSDFSIAHVIALDSNTYVLQCAADKPGSFYAVPRLLKMDSTGFISDTFFVDIHGVYNSTSNLGLLHGANNTFWALTSIGTIGISNEIRIVRCDTNLDTLKNIIRSNYYKQQFRTNHPGELEVRMEYDDFYDSLQGFYAGDIINKYDQNGNSIFSYGYTSFPLSNDFLLRDDGGFNTFRGNHYYYDTLFINHFDNNGLFQFGKTYTVSGDVLNGLFSYYPALAADSGYFLILTEHDSINYNLIKARLCKFNNQDDTLWTLNVFRNYLDAINQITPTSDGGCILLFHTNGFGDTLNYLMKIGAHGENILSVPERNENPLLIYPNPTTNMFTIKNLSSKEKTLLQVINPLGEIVYSIKLFGKNEYLIDANFAKGIYFVCVSDEEKNVVQKLIVE